MSHCYPILILTIAVGCAYSSVDPGVKGSVKRVAPSARMWVLAPEDGAYGKERYHGSGRSVGRRTLSIVRQRFPLAQLPRGRSSDEGAALQRARAGRVDFIVSPEILHWEDRATPWSGFRDKVRVEVRLLRVHPPTLIRSVVFESRNNSITFIDGRPEDLLDRDYEKAVLSIL
jgi:hypothetical protein